MSAGNNVPVGYEHCILMSKEEYEKVKNDGHVIEVGDKFFIFEYNGKVYIVYDK